jgi:mono/diheme cytochrome c family protein
MTRFPFVPIGVAAVFVVIALTAGCEKKTPPPSGGAAPPGPTTPPNAGGTPSSPGRGVFETQGCLRCHTVNAPDGGVGREKGGKNKGPDLGKVGADPAHTKDWLAAYIRDPKSQNPMAHMPPHAGKINEEDLAKLTDYLAGLK